VTAEELVQEARRLAGDVALDSDEFLPNYIKIEQKRFKMPVESWSAAACRHVAREAAKALCLLWEMPWGGR